MGASSFLQTTSNLFHWCSDPPITFDVAVKEEWARHLAPIGVAQWKTSDGAGERGHCRDVEV